MTHFLNPVRDISFDRGRVDRPRPGNRFPSCDRSKNRHLKDEAVQQVSEQRRR